MMVPRARFVALLCSVVVLVSAGLAGAADWDNLIIGTTNESNNTTELRGFGTGGGYPDATLYVTAADSFGPAIEGASVNGVGAGVRGSGKIGVIGAALCNWDANPPCPPDATGVLGSTGNGVGVRGFARGSGSKSIGVLAEALRGKAIGLKVTGRAVFQTAGLVTISSGSDSAAVTSPVPLSATSQVLVTLQSPGGAVSYVERGVPTAASFTIHLVAPASENVTAAWFLMG